MPSGDVTPSSATLPADRARTPDDRHLPTRVLHRAGNLRELLPLVGHPAVDAIEADVWVRSGKVVAHHERPLGPLPLTISARGIRLEPQQPVDFAELLEAVNGRAELVLDLRSWLGDPAPDVARGLLELPDRSHLHVSCESWAIADRLRAWLPDQHVMYSVRTERQLRDYIAGRMAGTREPVSLMMRHTLIHGPIGLESIRARAESVGVWTVDDPQRARTLARWGVDLIVSNRLDILGSLRRDAR